MRSTPRSRRSRAIRDGAIVIASILGILALATWTSPAGAQPSSSTFDPPTCPLSL